MRGGAWCTTNVLIETCDECKLLGISPGGNKIYAKCETAGADFACDTTNASLCTECILGTESECGGDIYTYNELYDPDGAPICSGGGIPGTNGCFRYKDTNTERMTSGTCPFNCPSGPGTGD